MDSIASSACLQIICLSNDLGSHWQQAQKAMLFEAMALRRQEKTHSARGTVGSKLVVVPGLEPGTSAL
jgi:hypothetical protein